MITNFNNFLNEGLRSKMTPKSKDAVINVFKKLTDKEKIKYIKNHSDEDFLNDIEEIKDIHAEIKRMESLRKSFIKLINMIVNKEDESVIKKLSNKFGEKENEKIEEIRKRMNELDDLSERLQKTNSIDINNPEYYNGKEFVEYSFHIANKNNKQFIAGMSTNFETEDELCRTWYYLDNMTEYLDVNPDTIDELEKMIKIKVLK